jgi:UDP-N-acetylmuramate dehydrogenase
MNHLQSKGDLVTAQAGVDNTDFATHCLDDSLAGASWMNRLPGQLGSTVRMNARCYGGEISRIVDSIKAVSPTGAVKTYTGKDALLGYKDTLFMQNNEVIAEIRFLLSSGNKEAIRQHMMYCETDRIQKKQFLYPSCGCVFKNDYTVGIPSGLLLEKAGVRKLSTDRVEISPYHANFLFNKGATAREILTTALDMRDMTYETFGVWLAFEMELLGNIPDDLKKRYLTHHPSHVDEEKLAPIKASFLQKDSQSCG